MTFRENELSKTQSGTCFDRNLVKQRPVDRAPVDRENETAQVNGVRRSRETTAMNFGQDCLKKMRT